MLIVDPAHNRRVNTFSKSIFQSCKNMKKNTKILALSWESREDKQTIIEVLYHLRKLGLVDYSAGFETVKITFTALGRKRLNEYDDWYETVDKLNKKDKV